MKSNSETILMILCAVLGCLTIFFGYSYFNQEECAPVYSTTNNGTNNSNTNQNSQDGAVKEITVADFKAKVDNKETFYLYISQTTCGYCIQFEPTLTTVFENRNLVAYKINYNLLSQEDRALFKTIYTASISTPTMVYYKSGTETNKIVGSREESAFSSWVSENK